MGSASTFGISSIGFKVGRSTEKKSTPLDLILADIDRALDAELWYLALAVTLSIPDICSSAEIKREPGEKIWKGTEDRYTRWCAAHLIPKFSQFTATDCWALRGGITHNAKLFGHPKQKYDRVVFTLPEPGANVWHECLSANTATAEGVALQLDLRTFCGQMTDAAKEWQARNAGNEIVEANLANLVHRRPQGLPPHFVGMPVIA